MADKTQKSLCDSCINYDCIFQSGIVRTHCNFYVPESGDEKITPNEAIEILKENLCVLCATNDPPRPFNPAERKEKTGQWIRMSDLSEQEDDRYKCSHCGNVIHHKNKMDLYTFNSWCGKCGSYNGRK